MLTMLYESKIIEALNRLNLGFKYILSDRNGVEPEAPYVLVSVLAPRDIGSANKNISSKTNIESISKPVQFLCRLTLHALTTDIKQEDFESLRIGIAESDTYLSSFSQSGLGVLSVGDAMYSSTPVDTVMYKRSIFDIQILTTRLEEFSVNTISEVNMTGKLTNQDETETEIQVEVEL